MKSIYTDIIWDFNGTIIDDVEAGIVSVNKLLSDRGLPLIPDKESYRRLFRFPIIEYYRSLGFDFDSEPYEVLAPLWVAEYLENSKSSPLREGFLEVLEKFKALGLPQHVISATEINMLCRQLRDFHIIDSFESVSGLDNIHASSKTELAVNFRNSHKESRALFIGDTDHDFDTAVAMGADCALICGGHNSKQKLLSCKGALVFDSFSDFYNYFCENCLI